MPDIDKQVWHGQQNSTSDRYKPVKVSIWSQKLDIPLVEKHLDYQNLSDFATGESWVKPSNAEYLPNDAETIWNLK